MAKDLNRVTLIGRLTKDPVTKQVGDNQVSGFSLAINGYKDGEVYFFNCNAWGKTSEIISKFCKKGQKICVDGELKQRVWEDNGNKRQAVDVQVLSFYFLEKKSESSPTDSPQSAPEPSGGLGTVVNDAPSIDDGFDPFGPDGVPM